MGKLETLSNDLFQITKTTLDGAEVNSVNSREIYEHLEVSTRYNDWIQRAIEKYDFEAGVDYVLLKNEKNPEGGRPSIDYIVTIDMAKELCMVSNTSKGKETRRYFIEVEKRANKPMTIDQLLAYNAKVISFLQEENVVLTKQNKEMLPKAVFADSVAQSDQSILVGQFAKLISDENFKIGQNRLFKWLRSNGYLHKQGHQYNQPLQRWKEQGLFETIERTVNNPDGSVRLTITTKITGKGQIYLTEKLKKSFS